MNADRPAMEMTPAEIPRQPIPKRLAVIDRDNCTGCEACVEICPVDCIELRSIELGIKGVHCWCEVDWDRCIGCELCIHIPRRKGDPDPYELLVCPWDAIEMVASADLPRLSDDEYAE